MTVSEKIARLLEMDSRATAAPWKWQDWSTCGDPDTGPNKDTLVGVQLPSTFPSAYPMHDLILSFEDPPSNPADLEWIAEFRNASRPLLLALQALLLERSLEGMHQYGDFIKARKLADAALKELEDAAI